MDIEEQLVTLVLRKPLLEFAGDGAVGRTHITMDYFAQYGMHVGHLSQLKSAPVVQQLGAIADDERGHSGLTRMGTVVKGVRIEPETVEGTAETVALIVLQHPPVLEVVLPLLEGINIAPSFRNATSLDNLLEQRERERHGADEVCGLASIVGQELHNILKRAVLRFGGVLEDVELLGRVVYTMKAMAG